ncbi:MAG: sodium:proton antiporter [Pyrinomonadaceae bacterium]|nr:sodium:proton antiporter [Pyrinomonadaceae bacterium]
MNLTAILLIAFLFFAYSLVSRKIASSVLTPPMIFTAAGLLIAKLQPAIFGGTIEHSFVHLLAELTLIFVLFTDAAAIDASSLKKDYGLATRMLTIGLPVTILVGAFTAFFVLGVFSIWECALLAAILAPTDAALGQSVVSSKIVPERIRQTISVESGLNDGLCLPLVLMFAGAAAMSQSEPAELVRFTVLQVSLGPIAGVVVGFLGAKLIDLAVDKKAISGSMEGIAALCVSLGAFGIAESIHGNGFIAAFVAGLTFGAVLRHRCKFLYEFAESEGRFFTLSTFLIFGAVAMHLIGDTFQWSYVIYAFLSLTVVRMIPVVLSLIGTDTDFTSKVFLGWFGPRGLASILFALLIIERQHIAGAQGIISVVVITVLLSVLLHGLSAAWLSKKLGEFLEGRD